MLRTWSILRGRAIRAVDGLCGRVDDVLFDDRDATVRHIVVAIGMWPLRRRVLLLPHCVSSKDGEQKSLWTAMTREEINRAPGLDTQPPVSRQREREAEEMLGRLAPHSGAASWGVLGIPPLPCSEISMEEEARREIEREAEELKAEELKAEELTPFDAFQMCHDEDADGAAHLRSAREVVGYAVEAEGARVGRVTDLWLDGYTWRIAHLTLQEGGRLNLGRRAAVPATLVSAISWGERTVELDARCEMSGNGPVLRPRATSPRLLPSLSQAA